MKVGSAVEIIRAVAKAKCRSRKPCSRDYKKFVLTGWTVIEMLACTSTDEQNQQIITDLVVKLWNENEYPLYVNL